MNGNAELLNYIYQNSEMGVNTVNQMLEITQDASFRQHLEKQRERYQSINEEAQSMLEKLHLDEKGLSKSSQIKTHMMVSMQTMTDHSTPHLAEMMLLGSNMGVIDALKNIRKYAQADAEVLTLMKQLLHFEEECVERLKPFI